MIVNIYKTLFINLNIKGYNNSHELLLEANFHIDRSMLLFKTTEYTVKQEQIINWTCCNS